MSNVLDKSKRVQLLACLTEGMSLRSTSRVCDVAFNTVLKFVPLMGQACSDYQDKVLRNLKCETLELDEQWNFCFGKDRNLPENKRDKFGFGSVWTWCALARETRLIPSWFVGDRSAQSAYLFLSDLRSRVVGSPQITSDGFNAYPGAVEAAFGTNVHFAQLIKNYAQVGDSRSAEVRYSPPPVTSITKQIVIGEPNPDFISTSLIERVNLQMRMAMRRCTRLTNGHSKKLENHCHALAIFFMHYNFARRHESLRCSPAMAAGVTSKLWDLGDIVDLLDQQPASAAA